MSQATHMNASCHDLWIIFLLSRSSLGTDILAFNHQDKTER